MAPRPRDVGDCLAGVYPPGASGAAGMSMSISNAAATDARTRVLDSVSAVLGVRASTLTDESSPATVPEWDSLNHLNIAMSIESEFRIALTAEQVVGMDSIGAICATLRDSGIEI